MKRPIVIVEGKVYRNVLPYHLMLDYLSCKYTFRNKNVTLHHEDETETHILNAEITKHRRPSGRIVYLINPSPPSPSR